VQNFDFEQGMALTAELLEAEKGKVSCVYPVVRSSLVLLRTAFRQIQNGSSLLDAGIASGEISSALFFG
jgi:hypothetical protein